VELGAPLRVAGLGGLVTAHGVVGGLHTSPARIDASAPQEGLQYGLTPLGAGALLGVSAAELRGLAVDLADVLGRRGVALVDAIESASSWRERFRLLDAGLNQRLDGRPAAAPPEVREAWRLIFAGDATRVAAVAEHVGWSRRHLSAQFRALTGLTPKQAARIARFEAARGLLLRSGRPSLIEVATCCGYADQSHLSREWQALAGCTIGTWLREELPFVQDSMGAGGPDFPA
jgi:AraC-like DNA-binding protein